MYGESKGAGWRATTAHPQQRPAELFRILFRRNNLVPEETIFIDDSIKNVDAARALGLQAIHFGSPDQLEQDLLRSGVLRAGA